MDQNKDQFESCIQPSQLRVKKKKKKGEEKRRREVDSAGCADRCRRPCFSISKRRNKDGQTKTKSQKKKAGKGKGQGKRGREAGMALHASHLIRRSRVCPVHVDVSLRASVAGERQELPRA